MENWELPQQFRMSVRNPVMLTNLLIWSLVFCHLAGPLRCNSKSSKCKCYYIQYLYLNVFLNIYPILFIQQCTCVVSKPVRYN